MERYNPFASAADQSRPAACSAPLARLDSAGSSARLAASSAAAPFQLGSDSSLSFKTHLPTTQKLSSAQLTAKTRYTTSFPDPLDDSEPAPVPAESDEAAAGCPTARLTSVTLASSSHSVDDTMASSRTGERPAGAFSSFLTRATSVTSSSVTDRVSEAVGSVRSAVDSLSSQFQQVVPSGLNERLSSSQISSPASEHQSIAQQQSAASFLASKFSSATGQITSAVQSTSSLPVISRQRVLLILDSANNTNWPLQFSNYRRLIMGTGSAQSALTSFFSSASAISSTITNGADGSDLIEQASFKDVTVFSNQTSSISTLIVNQRSVGQQKSSSARTMPSNRIIRPEYVLVRERSKDHSDQLKSVVTALNYCLIPLFEPIELWSIFQDRQLLFAKLLKIQRRLGKENFPLIPQVFCQTSQDLMNYMNSSLSITPPCLMRIGPNSKNKIKADNLQVLRALASITDSSCTLEPYLEVKNDLILQKIGNNIKVFKRDANLGGSLDSSQQPTNTLEQNKGYLSSKLDQSSLTRQSTTRQSSIGVLSSLIPSSSQQQTIRHGSNISSTFYEKLSDTALSIRYKNWIDAIVNEFGEDLSAFSLKIINTVSDREYIIGLEDCSMNFLGNLSNQEEDRANFVKLITNKMDGVLPMKTSLKYESTPIMSTTNYVRDPVMRRSSNDDKSITKQNLTISRHTNGSALVDKRKFTSQTHINGTVDTYGYRSSYGQLSSRSQSVSVNQSDYLNNEEPTMRKSPYIFGQSSDVNDELEDSMDSQQSSSAMTFLTGSIISNNRPSSLGQSFLDQTSTAFSSLQKQSLSLFKRFDTRAGDNTPPQSAKSDQIFEHSFLMSKDQKSSEAGNMRGLRGSGFKSQSVDCPTLDNLSTGGESGLKRPPKPPPPLPHRMIGRQVQSISCSSPVATHSNISTTNNYSNRDSSISDCINEGSLDNSRQRTKVVRQNSALSTYDPFALNMVSQSEDSIARAQLAEGSISSKQSPGSLFDVRDEKRNKLIGSTKRSSNFDSASITSGESNSTNETNTAEDTMNNLKKTFASIFGDKCE